MILPTKALSVRQPWAWAIIHADKDVENREWRAGNPDRKFRGRICIHASGGMTQAEYKSAAMFMLDKRGIVCPEPAELVRGGIIGHVTLYDTTTFSHSPWFFGPLGLLLSDPIALDEPVPVSGQVNIFAWRKAGNLVAPQKWMLNRGNELPL